MKITKQDKIDILKKRFTKKEFIRGRNDAIEEVKIVLDIEALAKYILDLEEKIDKKPFVGNDPIRPKPSDDTVERGL